MPGAPRPDHEISLKQGASVWRGFADSSDTYPTEGTFAVLRNGYISRDGTEIITSPGARRSGRPYYLDGGQNRGFDGSTGAGYSLFAGGSGTAQFTQVHLLEDTTLTFDYLMLSDNDGTLTDGYYLARRTTNAQVTFNASVTPSGGGGFFFSRIPISTGAQFGSLSSPRKVGDVYPFHAIAQVGNYPAIVANVHTATLDGASQRRHIGTWVAQTLLSFDSPPAQWRLWGSAVNGAFFVGPNLDGQRGITNVADGSQYDLPARRRGVVDVTNDDLLIAVPGHGVMHRCPVSALNKSVLSGMLTQLLGMPKAMVHSVASNSSGTGSLTAGNSYWVAIAYKNPITGEIGLPSDPLQVTVSGGHDSIVAAVWNARLLLSEVANYSFLVYLSEGNAAGSGVLRLVSEQAAVGGAFDIAFETLNVLIESNTPLDRRFPRLTQYPYGASFVKTVRGATFGGGMIGSNLVDTGTDYENIAIQLTAGASQIHIRTGLDTGSGRLAANSQLPNCFAGFEAYLSDLTFGTMQLLNKRLPQQNSTAPGTECQWEMIPAVEDGSFGSGGETDLRILFPRGMIWFSELGLPGVTPSINRIIVDRIQGRDFVAAGRVGQSLLLMTEKETFLFSWGRSPIGEDAVMLSDTFGCVAPQSVVEFEGTAAWLSHLGPVVLQRGNVVWIGKRILDYWKALQRDSRGMMLHGQGVHDTERKLIMWPIRSDWSSDVDLYSGLADDDVKSFYGCDEWLIWNYESDAFQTMRFSAGRWCNAVARMRHDDGIWRTAFISNIVDVDNVGSTAVAPRDFFDVYSLEDDYVDHRDQPLQVTATEGPASSGTVFVGSSGDFTGVRTGDYAFIRTGDNVLNWHGTVGAVVTVNAADDGITIDTPGSGTWATGSIIEIGIMPPMVLTTQKMRFGEFRREYILNSVTLRHRLRRPYPDAATFHGWVQITATNEAGSSVNFHPALPSTVTSTDSIARQLTQSQTKLDNGRIDGNDVQLTLTFITDGIIHVKDVVMEMNQGG